MPQTREVRDFASEIKFVVDLPVAATIRDWARARLDADPYGLGPSGDEYLTTTLYHDTAAFDVFNRRGSFGRSKYRIRRYHDETTLFLERKLRRGTLLSKRRSLLPVDQLSQLENGHLPEGSEWFVNRTTLRALHPICQIRYNRTARVAERETGRIRLTVDTNIAALRQPRLAFAEGAGTPVLDNQAIVELKYHAALPGVFKALMDDFRLTPARVSKYRLAIATLGLAPGTDDASPATSDATYA